MKHVNSSHLRARDLAAITGLTARYFQKLAKHVGWATRPDDCRAIMFERSGFEAWLASGKPKDPKKCRSIGGMAGRGGARRSRVSNTATPLALVLKEKLKRLTTNG